LFGRGHNGGGGANEREGQGERNRAIGRKPHEPPASPHYSAGLARPALDDGQQG
jgi:hypothetical protein